VSSIPNAGSFYFSFFSFFSCSFCQVWVIANPTGLDSRLLLIGLDNRQTNLILFVDANPKNKNRLSKLVGLTMLFAVGGFWTNVGNPTVYPPGKPPTLLTVSVVTKNPWYY
jgi:hypothetical protein